MMIHTAIGLKAQYKLRILNADRSLKWESGWIPNLITDLGMDRIGNAAGGTFGNFLRIGTGTAAPAFTDTQLQAQVASTTTVVGTPTNTNAGAPNYETLSSTTYEFAQSAVVGNMAELGVGWTASTANTLATRSRILDGGGNPTTITVLTGEILQVTYQMRAFPQITDSVGNVTISAVVYAYTARIFSAATALGFRLNSVYLSTVSGFSAFTGSLGSITSAGPSGTTAPLTAGAFSAYTNGTFFRDYTATAAISVGNLAGGIKSITSVLSNSVGDWSRSQIEFTPNIPKDNTKTMSLTFRTSWARH